MLRTSCGLTRLNHASRSPRDLPRLSKPFACRLRRPGVGVAWGVAGEVGVATAIACIASAARMLVAEGIDAAAAAAAVEEDDAAAAGAVAGVLLLLAGVV